MSMNYVDSLPKSSNFRKGGTCEALLQIIALRGMARFRERSWHVQHRSRRALHALGKVPSNSFFAEFLLRTASASSSNNCRPEAGGPSRRDAGVPPTGTAGVAPACCGRRNSG